MKVNGNGSQKWPVGVVGKRVFTIPDGINGAHEVNSQPTKYYARDVSYDRLESGQVYVRQVARGENTSMGKWGWVGDIVPLPAGTVVELLSEDQGKFVEITQFREGVLSRGGRER